MMNLRHGQVESSVMRSLRPTKMMSLDISRK